jgi:hypothetical protein
MSIPPERLTVSPLKAEKVLAFGEKPIFHDGIEQVQHPEWHSLTTIAQVEFRQPRMPIGYVELIRAEPKDAVDPWELLVCNSTSAISLKGGKSMRSIRLNPKAHIEVLHPSPRPFPIDFAGRFYDGETIIGDNETTISDAQTALHVKLRRSGAVCLDVFCTSGLKVYANWSEAFGSVPEQRKPLPQELGKLSLVRPQTA